jgi:hypothetical protein
VFDITLPSGTVKTVTVGRDLDLSARRLSISFVVDRDDASDFRELDSPGDTEELQGVGGVFRTVNRQDANEVSISPGSGVKPPLVDANYEIQSYQESAVGPAKREIDLSLRRVDNRTEQYPNSQTTAPLIVNAAGFGVSFGNSFGSGSLVETWQLTTGLGRSLRLAATQLGQQRLQGSARGPQLPVQLRVSDGQAAALLDSLGYPSGVIEREVPDAEDVVLDTSPNDRHTFTVSNSPAPRKLFNGDYVVTDWRLNLASSSATNRWAVELRLVPQSITRP